MKQPVIYKITNVVNKKFYVGSTGDTRERFRAHRRKLRKGVHHCKHLQAAWSKYGEDCFKFEVVEVVATMALLPAAEDVWLAQYVGKPNCYNSGTSAVAPMRGRTGAAHPSFGKAVTPEQKAAISKTLKEFYAADYNNHPRVGKKHTPEARAKIRANRTPTEGASHYRYGTTLSPEVREKIGAAQRGVKKGPRVLTEEGRAKIAAAAAAGHYSNFTGKKHTEEARAKMSRPVTSIDPEGDENTFSSITVLCNVLKLHGPTVHRALRSGKPVKFGPFSGWRFVDAEEYDEADYPPGPPPSKDDARRMLEQYRADILRNKEGVSPEELAEHKKRLAEGYEELSKM